MVDYSKLETVQVEREGKILVATLNRPESLNAVNPQLHEEIEKFLQLLSTDAEANAAVITGAGRAFSAGGDVRGMWDQFNDRDGRFTRSVESTGIARRLITAMMEVEQPIVAAVNGDAIGFGSTLSLFCDIVIAAENARFGDPHVKVGLVAGDGGAVIWSALVGVNRAKQFLMTGDLIDAREAERIGLVNRVLPREEVLAAAKEMATRLANGPILAIKWTKASVNKQLREQLNLSLDASLALETMSMLTDDHGEAVAAFLQKRAPKFCGR